MIHLAMTGVAGTKSGLAVLLGLSRIDLQNLAGRHNIDLVSTNLGIPGPAFKIIVLFGETDDEIMEMVEGLAEFDSKTKYYHKHGDDVRTTIGDPSIMKIPAMPIVPWHSPAFWKIGRWYSFKSSGDTVAGKCAGAGPDGTGMDCVRIVTSDGHQTSYLLRVLRDVVEIGNELA